MLMGMMSVMALLDVLGVASIMPFIAVMASPEVALANPILANIYTRLEFESHQGFLLFLGGAAFLLLLISLGFKALTTYVQMRFTLMREFSLGKRVLEAYLQQPYSWFLNRHSAELGKTVLSEVGNVVAGGVAPLMTIFAQGAVTVALVGLLLLVDPLLTVAVCVVLCIAYGAILKFMGSFLSRIGVGRFEANQRRYGAVSEAFGAVKEIKVGGLERLYVDRFSVPAEAYAKNQAAASGAALLPRFALEAIAFGGMLVVVLYQIATSGGLGSALPVITVYAFAGYRLMPALQQVYAALTQLRFVAPALDAVYKDMNACAQVAKVEADNLDCKFSDSISLSQVSYTYPGASRPALECVDLFISANTTIGLVGSTGSGKTTIVDVILGLLTPQDGGLFADGVRVDDACRRSWQKQIGYVPQSIFLTDDTVAANIAFGVPAQDIDQLAVVRAAQIANLHDFVERDLPQGYATEVGERGVRLSGGQRQRIGIARALYHNPRVLILDEATSALDSLTEQAVMDAVERLGNGITIILIAHRLGTVRQCDQIFLLDKGCVKAKGTFEQLTQTNELFRSMTKNQPM